MAYFKYKEKQVYYEERGVGEPLLFLHGNTASSKMFESVINLYEDRFKVILIDFLGHGQSERIDQFPVDFWFDEAMQVVALLEQLKIKKVNIVGSSGGALVALNVALENPELVKSIIADSFEGERVSEHLTEQLFTQREGSKQTEGGQFFYSFCHGADWECVVDNDTRAVCEHARYIKSFFHKPLEQLQVKTLLVGSKEDEFIGDVCEKIYTDLLRKIKKGDMYLFNHGGHPAIVSNSKDFAEIVKGFI